MNYEVDGTYHRITLDKDEMLILISLLSEGLENLLRKAGASLVNTGKYNTGKIFVDDLNQRIMRS
jgi:hypothetical protein